MKERKKETVQDFGRARVICMIPALREESFFQWCWQRQKMYSVVIYSVSTVNHARSRGLWVTCGCLLGQHHEAHHETHDSVIWCSTATQALWQMNFMAEKLPCEVPLKFLSHCDCLSHLGRNSRWQLFKYTPQGNVLLIVSLNTVCVSICGCRNEIRVKSYTDHWKSKTRSKANEVFN